MNPNKPLISDEMIINKIQDDLHWDVDGTSETNGMIAVAEYVRTIYESHLSTLTTENQSLKEQRDKLVELLKDASFKMQTTGGTAGTDNGLIESISQITSFLKENQL